MLTVGSIIEANAVDIDFLGQGVVKYDGYVVFVKGLLKDEKARIKIIELKKKFGTGVVLNRMIDAKERVCETHELGSLDLYHMDLKEQLLWQKYITEETLKKIAGLDIKVEDVLTDHKDLYYRNKSVFHVLKKDTLTLGLYNLDFNLIKVDHFLLASKQTNKLLKKINDAKIKLDQNVIHHIMFRENDLEEVLVTIVSSKETFSGLDDIIHLLKKEKSVIGITLNLKSNKHKILGETSYALYGENRITMPLKDQRIAIDDLSFFQVNTDMMHKTYELIASLIKPSRHVIDAYAGVGSIGYFIKDQASHISMIESNQASHQKAKSFKEEMAIHHVDLYLEKSEDYVKNLDADIIILDPPRQGLHELMTHHLMSKSYEQIIYLSCDVKTLARDLNILKSHYDIKKVYPIRMFYHTTELETLTLLEPKSV